MIEFIIPGNPVAKGRPKSFVNKKTGRIGVYTPAETRNFESYVKMLASDHAPEKLLDCPLCLEFVFYLQRPPSIPKKRIFPDVKPDWDNLCKSVCDGMEGVIYTNDSRIVDVIFRKRYGDPPRTEVRISEVVDQKIIKEV